MTTVDFTKVRWAGDDFILVTIREHSQEPVLLLSRGDVKNLNRVWNDNEVSR